MLYPPCYRAAFAFSDISKSPLHLPALRSACHASRSWRSDDFSTFHVINLNGQLRCGLNAGSSTIPCKHVDDLQPGYACKHWETCMYPVNSGRVEAPSDGASTTIRLISPYCPALALNRMEFPEGFSCRHLNPIRYVVSGLRTKYTARTQHAA